MLSRVRMLRTILASSAALVARPPAQAAVKLSSGVEELRKAASFIPGYGPPDIAYPSAFRGRWQVRSRVVDVRTPLGEEAAPAVELKAARQLLAQEGALASEARFIDVDNAGGIAISNEKADGVALSANTYSGTVIADRERAPAMEAVVLLRSARKAERTLCDSLEPIASEPDMRTEPLGCEVCARRHWLRVLLGRLARVICAFGA